MKEKKLDAEPTAAEQEADIPRPPSPEAVREISRQQELITDEWTGEEPGGAKR